MSQTEQESETRSRVTRPSRARRVRGSISFVPAAAEDDVETSKSVRAVVIAMAITFVMLLVFNSDGLRSWARDLPQGSLSDSVIVATEAWHQQMETIGFSAPKKIVRGWMERIRELEW